MIPRRDATSTALPDVRAVGWARRCAGSPRGWRDFRRHPLPSAFYGACFALMGFLVYIVFQHAYRVRVGAGHRILPGRAVPVHRPLRALAAATSAANPRGSRRRSTRGRPNKSAIGLFALVLGRDPAGVGARVAGRLRAVLHRGPAVARRLHGPDLRDEEPRIPAGLPGCRRVLRGAGLRDQRRVGADDAGPRHRRHRRRADQPQGGRGQRAPRWWSGASRSSRWSRWDSRRGSSDSSSRCRSSATRRGTRIASWWPRERPQKASVGSRG